jgi:hypothetical protein
LTLSGKCFVQGAELHNELLTEVLDELVACVDKSRGLMALGLVAKFVAFYLLVQVITLDFAALLVHLPYEIEFFRVSLKELLAVLRG